MAKESERMKLLKENFMPLHQKGYSICEIAEEYHLNFSTVYRVLQEIADANGVTRESLLQIVRNPGERNLREERKYVRVNVEEIERGFDEADKTISGLAEMIDKFLKEAHNDVAYDY